MLAPWKVNLQAWPCFPELWADGQNDLGWPKSELTLPSDSAPAWTRVTWSHRICLETPQFVPEHSGPWRRAVSWPRRHLGGLWYWHRGQRGQGCHWCLTTHQTAPQGRTCESLSHVRRFAALWTVACQARHGISQTRILERLAISFFEGSSRSRDGNRPGNRIPPRDQAQNVSGAEAETLLWNLTLTRRGRLLASDWHIAINGRWGVTMWWLSGQSLADDSGEGRSWILSPASDRKVTGPGHCGTWPSGAAPTLAVSTACVMPYEPIHSLKGFLLVSERQGKLGDDNPTVGDRTGFVGKMFMEP